MSNTTDESLLLSRGDSNLVEFNQSLISSIDHLIEVSEGVIPSSSYVKAKNKIQFLKNQHKIPGLISLIHHSLLQAIQGEDVQRANKAIESLLALDSLNNSINFLNIEWINPFFKSEFKKILMEERLEQASYFNLEGNEFENVKSYLLFGLKTLENHFPIYFNEINELVTDILLVKGTELKAGTSFNFFGIIYINTLYKCKKLYEVLDVLIHEASHLLLHLKNYKDPLVLNPSDIVESPLRKEKRPLIGTFHASFVLVRIIDVLSGALRKGLIENSDLNECNELVRYYFHRATLGWNVIEENAELTPEGAKIMQESKTLLTSLTYC